MSSVGLLAWRSALQMGQPVSVPDFRDSEARNDYKDDHLQAGPNVPEEIRVPSSIRGDFKIDPIVLERAQTYWND